MYAQHLASWGWAVLQYDLPMWPLTADRVEVGDMGPIIQEEGRHRHGVAAGTTTATATISLADDGDGEGSCRYYC